MAAPEKFLLVSRGGPGDRQQTAYATEVNARKRFDENAEQGRAAWLYGQADAEGVRPLLEQTHRAVQ